MSRLSSRRVAIELSIERIELVEKAIVDERDSSAFIGASRTGSLTSEPARNELIHLTSRNRRSVCRKVSTMPMSKMPAIRPFRPGLVAKAVDIWRARMAAMKATMARNTTIDRRNTCGLDSLCGSYSITSDEPTSPIDLKMPILAPIPLPAVNLSTTLSGNMSKMEDTWRAAALAGGVFRAWPRPGSR